MRARSSADAEGGVETGSVQIARPFPRAGLASARHRVQWPVALLFLALLSGGSYLLGHEVAAGLSLPSVSIISSHPHAPRDISGASGSLGRAPGFHSGAPAGHRTSGSSTSGKNHSAVSAQPSVTPSQQSLPAGVSTGPTVGLPIANLSTTNAPASIAAPDSTPETTTFGPAAGLNSASAATSCPTTTGASPTALDPGASAGADNPGLACPAAPASPLVPLPPAPPTLPVPAVLTTGAA